VAVAGNVLRTREDVRRYLDEISDRNRDSSSATHLWHTAKQGMWLLLLISAYLQYYLLDILVQIDSMPGITVSVPMTPPRSRAVREVEDLRVWRSSSHATRLSGKIAPTSEWRLQCPTWNSCFRADCVSSAIRIGIRVDPASAGIVVCRRRPTALGRQQV
jgi:hypothetical protein